MIATVPAIIAIVAAVLQGAQTAVQIGKDASPFISILKDFFSKDEITEEDLANVQQQVDALHAELQSPLPPEG